MKPNGPSRKNAPEDTLHKAVKLPPIKKSGKERQSLYRALDGEEEDELLRPRRESALDYYDDTDEGWDTPDEDDALDEDPEDDWEKIDE